MAKITKRDIKDQLDKTPIDSLLLGKGTKRAFTSKQKKFAKQVAMGSTLSDAYRIAYDTEGKPNIVNSEASKLANSPKIAQLITAYSDAIEASKYRTPAQLRELVIHQLTITAVSDEVSVRDRLTALKMLGTVSEVSAFTERKESLVIHESSKVKQQLLDQLKTIVSGEVREIPSDIDEGEELLAMLSGVRPDNGSISDTHPEGDTPNRPVNDSNTIHNIPHNELPVENLHNELPSENLEMTSVSHSGTGQINSFEEGVGGEESSGESEDVDYREVPPSENGSPADGGGV
jgi:hypothetical protein